MESDLQITVKGVPDELAFKLGNAVGAVIKGLAAVLDFSRMHRVIITNDFAGELRELSKITKSGNAITFTNEAYAMAVAKVLLLPAGGDRLEILPVLNADIVTGILDDPESERFRWVLHMLHHEFSHVHDDNKKLDAMPGIWLSTSYRGKDIFIGPLSETCWSEYVANRLSSSSAIDAAVMSMCDSFADALERTKDAVDLEIGLYRIHADLNSLIEFFKRDGEFLARTAAYVIGYCDGLQRDLQSLSPRAAELLAGSYFESTWNSMRFALSEMWQVYPDGWRDLSAYQRLAESMENYYAQMGLILSTTDDGHAYVHIP